MSTAKNKQEPVVNEIDELTKLRLRIAELEGRNNEPVEENENDETTDPLLEVKFNSDDYIKVMNLLLYNLNLSTKNPTDVGGKTKQFKKFGEIKNILYRDLVDIMDVHPNFVESGYFYIMNPAFVRQQGLDEMYSKILTKANIEEILSTNSDACISLYEASNPKQQEVIITMLVRKMNASPTLVNLNIIDKLSRATGIDIAKRAADTKPLEEEEESDK